MKINSPQFNLMHKACLKASRVLIRDFGEVEKLQVSEKGPGDFVTASDKRVEGIIIKELEKSEINQKLEKDKVDVTLPARERPNGKIHPVSQVIDEISSIFSEIGFSVAEGPDVETEYNNFTALNTPEDHPARDMHDTFYLDDNKKILLRTHTSPVQIRTMLSGKPPFKIIVPGRTYRCDSDQTHAPMFHQLEDYL